ncbi:MAG: hypothetical protein B6D63_02805 [Candidatus Latescibacteria bacterium 4484_7]|nr:MAG: hypothetical protein B6D63_02805 [Candidatus Latescibacteria bacterium 4484_7]
MSYPDIAVIVIYLVVVFLIGVFFSKRASGSTEQFFVSGRSLPWWIVGTSMVATTFAADTPLVVSGLVARGGIYKNWLWWQWGIGGIVAVFLFSRLWNRARITTDAELIELRYDGVPAKVLRGYKAAWFGIVQNIIVIAWVMRAMTKVIVVVMGWNDASVILHMRADVFTVLFLFTLTVFYTVLSGLWGVVITDFLQFVLAMAGSIYLAVAALARVGGIANLVQKLTTNGFDVRKVFTIVPGVEMIDRANPFTEFLVLILVVWWASYTIDGGGYLAQRLFAAKNEKHSILGYLWYSFAQICIRPWPWIIVGLVGMATFGHIGDPEKYYPMVMKSVLPVGFFGLVVASFFAAFMSTVDTQLNWGSSLIVNDLVRRFLMKGRSDRFYLVAARLSIIALAVLGAFVSFLIHDIAFAWKLVISITAGLGSVYIARWYWWRVNAWSEISAMIAALVCTIVFGHLSAQRGAGGEIFDFPFSVLWTVMISIPTWVSVTLLTKPVGTEHLKRFYARVHPGGAGWKKIRDLMQLEHEDRLGWRVFVEIVTGIIMINLALVGTGELILGSTAKGIVMLGIAAASLIALLFQLKRWNFSLQR